MYDVVLMVLKVHCLWLVTVGLMSDWWVLSADVWTVYSVIYRLERCAAQL